MNTKEKIAVMQAFEDGVPVQRRLSTEHNSDTAWATVTGTPSWNWDRYEWRIKPQPKDIWVNEYAEGNPWAAHESSDAAIIYAASHASRVAVHYREVLEDE